MALDDRGSSNVMVSRTIVTDRQRFVFGDFYLANSCGMLLFSSLYVPCTKRGRYKNIMHNILRSTAKIFNMITLYTHFISLQNFSLHIRISFSRKFGITYTFI